MSYTPSPATRRAFSGRSRIVRRKRKTRRVRSRKKKSRHKKKTTHARRIRRRWPGFTAPRPKTRHYEVLHQAWSRGRGNWYIMGFAPNKEAARGIIAKSDRPGDFGFREVIDGKPSLKNWRTTKISERKIYY